MYDKPHTRFKLLNAEEKKKFHSKLVKKYFIDEFTAFVENKDDTPALIVSCSSWTEDEDFHILIDALESWIVLFMLN